MIVEISSDWLKELKPKAESLQKVIESSWRAKRHRVDLRMFSASELVKLESLAKAKKGSGWRSMVMAIETFRLMMADPGGRVPVKLTELPALFTKHFEANAPKKWVFAVVGNKRFPYFVNKIEYHPAVTRDRVRYPAYVQMDLVAAYGETATVKWLGEDLDGKRTIPRLLSKKGLQTENDALMAHYTNEMAIWNQVTDDVGATFHATGMAHQAGVSWYSWGNELNMEREGKPARVVIDTGKDETTQDEDGRPRPLVYRKNNGKGSIGNSGFWDAEKLLGKPKRRDDDDDEEWDEELWGSGENEDEVPEDSNMVALPVHPWVHIFDLELHQFAQIHVADLEAYQWDDKLIDKLVLPDDTFELIDALVVNADNVMEDIIKGKTGGTIVISTGPPGTGKTLTAEVMSEVAHRALYRVDCSQLGTDVETIEKRLGVVLRRATRWGAVLLIDEADVYIRARGDDINQNAIVGVFLRLLEYYHGILFLTSNRAVIIDDAILQRATAWVRYEIPTDDEKRRIWRILADQYQHEIPDELIDQLVKRWPLSTGRNIKMMLKLSRTIGLNNPDREGIDLFEMAAKFLDIKDNKLQKRKTREDSDIDQGAGS